MKRLVLGFALILTALAPTVFAQQAGENVNVLPVVSKDLFPDDWWLLGDGYLQRQVEPTIAASTRNPDHLLALFNDYRAVDVDDDIGLGEGERAQLAAIALKTVEFMLAGLVPRHGVPVIAPSPVAAAEAWVGMSRSYDGGLTWSGGFLPGAPFDGSPQSLVSPVKGYEAATDPVLVAGPCGQFYVVFVAFTRGDESSIAVARYEDLNNEPGGDTIVYRGATVIETGNNAEHGYFLDKPDIEIDIMRPGDPDNQCASRLYVSYSTFNGLTKDGKFQSKINLATSVDGGLTFTKSRIQQPYTQNQGSAITVDPRPGLPTDPEGGGAVYLIWRHFFGPDAMVMIRSTDFGKRWTKPIELTDSGMAPFDQPTISTLVAPIPDATDAPPPVNPGFPETAFRSNGFPTAAVTGDGTVYAAWQERVNLTTGLPDAGGPPRIVLTRSSDGGATWSDREAIDMSDRDVPLSFEPPGLPPAPVGFGTLPQHRASGPQVMPQLSYGGGRLMLGYFESRGRIANYGTPAEEIVTEADVSPYTGFISGYDRLLDFRTAILDPESGQALSSAQVSRYPLSAGADLGDGEDLVDVAPVNPPCSPDHDFLLELDPSPFPGDTEFPPCVRQVSRVGAPTSAAGTSPFIGDYPGLEPFVRFVVDGDGSWRWATLATDLPTPGFHSIWTDNRHLIPPQTGDPATEWTQYPDYDPPGTGDTSCVNPGSRNTDVLTSRVDAELVISSPTSYRLTGSQPARFPFSISNQTSVNRFYTLAIDPEVATVSLLPNQIVATLEVEIFPYSSTAQVVYVPAGVTQPVTVTVTETGVCDPCQTGSITFNAAASMANFDDGTPTTNAYFNPTVDGDAFVINYNVDNAFVINDGAENAFVINPTTDNAFVINEGEENAFVINAFVINAFVINAFVINPAPGEEPPPIPSYYDVHDVVDTTWTVTPGASTEASSFLPLLNIDNAEYFLDNYVFQLIVSKGSSYGTLDGCDPANVNQTQILSTFAQGPGTDPENAFVINKSPENAFVINEGLDNAFVINSTFTMAPSDNPPETNGASFAKNGVEYIPNDGTLKGPRVPDHVYVTLRAHQIKPDGLLPIDPITGDPYKFNPDPDPATGGSLPSMTVMELACDPESDEECFDKQGPDLMIPEKEALEALELSVAPCGTVDFPAFTLRNQGYKDAIARRPLNPSYPYPGIMRHAIYLSDDPNLDPSDRILSPPTFNSETNPLAGENDPERTTEPYDESLGTVSVTMPPDVTGGSYYLILFVDYAIQVSEYDETNNTVVIPLTVAPSQVFSGLQSPLFYDNIHPANAGSAIPLLWQYVDSASGLPVDSSEPTPSILIHGFFGENCGSHGNVEPVAVLEDPGSSDLRYDPLLMKWQYNWQTKEGGDPLPTGCYEITISSSLTCASQGDGPFLVQLN